MTFKDCAQGILSYFNDSAYLREQWGIKLDCALFNEARNDAENEARFPMRLHLFGWTQSDGAGKWQPIYHFAIIGKLKRSAETDEAEMDFHDVCELVGQSLHQRTIADFAIVATKGFIFDQSMTVTSDNRRVTVKVADGEVGFGCFFWASKMAIADLASAATVTTVSPCDAAVGWPPPSGGSSSVIIGQSGNTVTQEQIDAYCSKQRTLGAQIF